MPENEPLRKITLNLYLRDVERLVARFGHGWSIALRDQVRRWLKEMEKDDA